MSVCNDGVQTESINNPYNGGKSLGWEGDRFWSVYIWDILSTVAEVHSECIPGVMWLT